MTDASLSEPSNDQERAAMKAEVFLPEDYRPAESEPFMNDRQLEYFRRKLIVWKQELLSQSAETIDNLQDSGRNVPDIADRASEETDRALELHEGSRAPVLYVPREDVAMALLDPTERHSTCPMKGEASYFSVVTPEARLDNAVWSYERPKAGAEAIAGHLAFYPDKIRVEPR